MTERIFINTIGESTFVGFHSPDGDHYGVSNYTGYNPGWGILADGTNYPNGDPVPDYEQAGNDIDTDSNVPKMIKRSLPFNCTVYNSAVSARMVSYFIDTESKAGSKTQLALNRSTLTCINLGINDAISGTLSGFENNFTTLIENCKRSGKIVIVIHPNALHPLFAPDNPDGTKNLEAISKKINEICYLKKVKLATTNLMVVDLDDAYHPIAGPTGYEKLGAPLISYVQNIAKSISDMSRIAGMYIACFNRTPEKPGLDYWTNHMQTHTRDYIGEAISDSGLGHDISDTDFINKMYDHLLNRVPDSEGLNYWLGVMSTAGSEKHGIVMNQIIDALYYETSDSQSDIDTYRHKVHCGIAYGHIYGKTQIATEDNLNSVTNNPSSVYTFTSSL